MSKKSTLWSMASLLTLAAMILSACGPAATTEAPVPTMAPAATTESPSATETSAVTETPAMTAEASAAAETPTSTSGGAATALRDPKDVALEAAGGQKIGGKLDMLAVWSGSEADSFNAVIQPFMDATGITVELEATRDMNAVLTTRVEGGNPPDLAAPPTASQAASWASEGKVIDLSTYLDMDQLKQDYAQSWIDLASTPDGKMFELFTWSALKGPIWYDPKTYDGPNPPKTWDELQAWAKTKADAGTTPWCIGLESGAASGWPGTDWIEDIVLRQSGPDVYDKWYRGEIPWTSPEIKNAFQTFGAIATDPKMVNGGPTAELTLNFGNGGDALFTTPPGCFLHHQATFITDFFTKNTPSVKPGDDFNFFAFPDINPQYAGSIEVVGDSISVYKDSPQAKALIRYLASPEAQAIWVQRGGKLPVNKRVPLDVYPDALAKNAGQIMANAKTVRFDASDQMPSAMNDAFFKAILDYVQSPDKLDSILANLDTVQKDAYKK